MVDIAHWLSGSHGNRHEVRLAMAGGHSKSPDERRCEAAARVEKRGGEAVPSRRTRPRSANLQW
jgi:hypothetical protein